MTEFYQNHSKLYVSVDCIIFGLIEGELSLLLIKRRFDPGKGQWSLMGGFVRSDESLNDAARRVLADLTGLDNVYMEQVGAFGEVNRDHGERVVSVAYYALMGFNEYDPQHLARHDAQWVALTQLPPLVFDHSQMVGQALDKLRRKVTHEPIGFNLLPKLFTLSQLQKLYETILSETLDKRNFRKRVAEMDFIEKTDQKDKAGSRRGAALYKFNDKIYQSGYKKFKI
ncbi:MAG: NUDIX hydrolase [Lachnoclostridium sp.]|nr:NUDIX hydrolase [Lachnoclostridium sp.]